MKRFLFLIGALMFLGAACTGNDAREDLDVEDQVNDDGIVANIVLNPDGFPNAAHKCYLDGQPGIWTNTDRAMWIVFNDPTCPGATETPMVVIDNIPGAP